jgi:hypothetical protein
VRIDRIIIIGHRTDRRFTRCCVASIRRWYPDRRITLIKDYEHGAYDTSDLESCFDVDVFPSATKRFGWGFARLEPLFLIERERCLILDSDIVFAGPVLERLESFDEDFIVEGAGHSPDETKQYYFDPNAISHLFPDFLFPGFVFNVGQIVATSGILRREMFEPFVTFCEPRQVRRQDIFFWEQGVLNFILLRMAQQGEVTIRRDMFMRWAGALPPEHVTAERITNGPPYDFLVHWAGLKRPILSKNLLPHILIHFETAYYRALRDCKRSNEEQAH